MKRARAFGAGQRKRIPRSPGKPLQDAHKLLIINNIWSSERAGSGRNRLGKYRQFGRVNKVTG